MYYSLFPWWTYIHAMILVVRCWCWCWCWWFGSRLPHLFHRLPAAISIHFRLWQRGRFRQRRFSAAAARWRRAGGQKNAVQRRRHVFVPRCRRRAAEYAGESDEDRHAVPQHHDARCGLKEKLINIIIAQKQMTIDNQDDT